MKHLFKMFIGLIILMNSSLIVGQEDGLIFQTGNTFKIDPGDSKEFIIAKAAHTVPTANQYAALKNEFIAFIHFGPNTFTRMEWGNGKEDPKIFNLQELDTDQWCKAIKAAGMKMVVFTAKHHDGFCLWQSRYTKHGVMSSPFKDGKGDVLKELSASCEKYGLKLGIYLSPADLYQIENEEGLYGNLSKYSDRVIPRPVEGRPFENKTTFTFKVDDYNEYFLNQLFELLTEYGPIHEVWFDGAHPKRKGGQKYNYLAWKELIHTLAPEAVVFGKQDLRWCGNESGKTRATEWNVVPYDGDPNQMNSFSDITAEDIGSREKIYKAAYLHYQPAETNTSIREGWFYRDENQQKVRSADDVFDIYERSVGGNSIFLLNMPPNREGRISPEDVRVLEETGKRINETYGVNLLKEANGPKAVLDNNLNSFELLNESSKEILIELPSEITINRFVIQEDIQSHGERIEKHSLFAWIDNNWIEVAKASNVGYKRILRFQDVTSKKFKLVVNESRLEPTIASISAHYYKSPPPELEINRDINGMVHIGPKKHDFNWKPHGEDISENLYGNYSIHYTIDGSDPDQKSIPYEGPFELTHGTVKAQSSEDGETGATASEEFGIVKKGWKIISSSGEMKKHKAADAIDGDQNTYWGSLQNEDGNHYLVIDLGEEVELSGFIYTPQTSYRGGMIESGELQFSKNGKSWKNEETFTFGNLINDPSKRRFNFKKKVHTRYIRLEAKAIAGQGKMATIAELDFLK